ncbi:5-oxoprolinase [Bacillus sp. MRMR6]|nr:5-oxoprolinase [Bacillus sp. MRMR6]
MRNALQSIAEEMGVTLIRTALSPNIKDRMDCSSAIYTKEGKLISQAEHIPLHLGLMPSVVEKVLKTYPPEKLKEGDAILINDPYISGSHLPDIFLISPVFVDGKIVAIAGNIAHHVDVGGMTPGSASTTATEIFQEGLRIPSVKIRNEGVINDDILRLFQANVRSQETYGDLYAQIAANNIAETRLKELFARYQADFLEDCMNEIMDYSERRMKAAIKRVPNGEYSFEDYLEGDGLSDELFKIMVKVSIKDEEVYLDFTGTDQQARGSINSTIGVTKACAYYTIKALFDADIPSNAGTFRPIHVIAPEGTLVNPKFPAPVSNGNANTSQRIVDTIFGALAQALPEKSMAACTGSMNGLTIGGFDYESNQYFSYVETTGGGQGGLLGMDGADGAHTNMTNTRNTPIEVIEQSYPIFIKRYGLAEDSGGSGKYRGGMGIIREIVIECEEATLSLRTERKRLSPWGLFGGKNGKPSKCLLTNGETGETIELPPKATIKVKKGDTLLLQTAGGGGYMDPLERSNQFIANDILSGATSIEKARKDYHFLYVKQS